jgi:large subunit ribosomal protein L9
MEVILLERISRLGQMGDVVRVRDGFARNFLLPQGKALRATDANRKQFESQRSHLEARNLERKQEAEAASKKVDGQSFIVIRQAGETGQLYGSVSSRDIAEAMETGGFSINRNQVALNQPIKTIGLHNVRIALHPEVEVSVTVNVARSADEAERQAKGEDLTVAQTEAEETEAEVEAAPAEAEAEAEAPAEPEAAEEPEARKPAKSRKA